jgi:hypothetical protein
MWCTGAVAQLKLTLFLMINIQRHEKSLPPKDKPVLGGAEGVRIRGVKISCFSLFYFPSPNPLSRWSGLMALRAE